MCVKIVIAEGEQWQRKINCNGVIEIAVGVGIVSGGTLLWRWMVVVMVLYR